MREVELTWGGAIKVTWSIGWRLVLYLIPAYLLGFVVMLVAMSAGDRLEGPVPWMVIAYYVLQVLWFAVIALAFLLAVKQVIGKSYSRSSFPPVPEEFRITLVCNGE